ncbi:MAG TPA: RDD family protein [Chloroflexia bacterium]|nr:RDD family protein [Chloroflexia bacterium]
MSNDQNPNPGSQSNRPQYQPPAGYDSPSGQGFPSAGTGYPPPGANYDPRYNYGAPPPPTQPPYGYQPYGYGGPVTEANLASVGKRFIALIIDSIIVNIPTSILYAILAAIIHPVWGGWGEWDAPNYPFRWSASIVFWGLYAWFCYMSLHGNTLGKSVMGIKLVNQDGTKPSMQTFILHFTIGYWINGLVLGIGFIWAIFDPGKQTWGQKVFRDSTVMGTW